MRGLQEELPVLQGHLGHRRDQLAQHLALVAAEVALLEHHLEEHADQVDDVLVRLGQLHCALLYAKLCG